MDLDTILLRLKLLPGLRVFGMIDQNLNARSQVTSEIQMEKNHCYIKKARVLNLFTYNTKHRIRNYHFFHKTTLAKQDKLIQCLHK